MTQIGSGQLRKACFVVIDQAFLGQHTKDTAFKLKSAAYRGIQIPLLSKNDPSFDQSSAYKISAANCMISRRFGWLPVGRKIGFTNQKIWTEYNVMEPNWGYLWDKKTFLDPKAMIINPATMMLQPRIEPEIIFRLKQPPHSQMTETEVLSCIEWMAHGYEIVVSLYKDWVFTAADTTAANALHNRLYIGKRVNPDGLDPDTVLAQLAGFQIKLYRDRVLMDTGSGSNVLGSPIKALLYLCRMLEGQKQHPGLCKGEIITTGTLTKAFPISDGETWSTVLKGVDLPGLDLRVFKMKPKKGSKRVAVTTEDEEQTTDGEQTIPKGEA